MSALRRSPPLPSAISSSSSLSDIGYSNDVIFMNDVARNDYHQGSSSSSSDTMYFNALAGSDWLDEEDDLVLGAQIDEAAPAEQNHVSITQVEELGPVEHGHTHVDTPEPEEQPVVVHNPEEGWDDDTPSKCEVLVDGQKVMRRVVYTAKKIEARSALPGGSYSRLFMERGCLQVVHRVLRPNRKTRIVTVPHYVFVFYVIQGAVSVTMLESSFIICTGGSFFIPPGNECVIRNVCDRDAKLFFVEAVER